MVGRPSVLGLGRLEIHTHSEFDSKLWCWVRNRVYRCNSFLSSESQLHTRYNNINTDSIASKIVPTYLEHIRTQNFIIPLRESPIVNVPARAVDLLWVTSFYPCCGASMVNASGLKVCSVPHVQGLMHWFLGCPFTVACQLTVCAFACQHPLATCECMPSCCRGLRYLHTNGAAAAVERRSSRKSRAANWNFCT